MYSRDGELLSCMVLKFIT